MATEYKNNTQFEEELLKLLGLENRMIKSVTVHVASGEVPQVDIQEVVTDLPKRLAPTKAASNSLWKGLFG